MLKVTDWPEWSPEYRQGSDIPLAPRSGSFHATGGVARLPQTLVSAVITAVFAPIGLLAHAKVRRFLLVIVVLNVPFPLDIHIGGHEYAAEYGSLEGFNISLTTFALAGLYLPVLAQGRRRPLSAALRSPDASVPLALYFLFSALSVLAAQDAMLALYEVFLLLQMFLVYFYLVRAVSSPDDVVLVIRFLVIGLVLQGILMMGLAGGLGEIHVPGLRADAASNETSDDIRVNGTFGSPNVAATYLSMAMGVAMSVMLAALGRRDKVLALVGVGAGIIALIFTFSRGGWAAFVVTLGILWIAVLRDRRRVDKRVWIAPALVLLLVAVCFSEPVTSRLVEDDRGAAKSRVPLMKLAALMIEDHPLLGVGANNFPVAMEPYVTLGFAGEFLYTVHNKYLVVWTETGAGGLIAFVLFLIATTRIGLRGWKHRDPLFSPLALGCTAALAGYMCHMLVDVFRGRPEVQMVSLLAGLLVPLERLAAFRQSARIERRAGRFHASVPSALVSRSN